MARIRSIHPGQWTDDKFLSCSPLCRLLVLALRNESDDNGIFKWNLVEIKIRCLPLDNVDVQELLDEAIQYNQLRKFEANDSTYGIIRNFQDWQRPKSPTFIYPVPEELLPLKGRGMGKGYRLNDKYMEEFNQLTMDDFPCPTEIPPQREGRREEVGGREGEEDGVEPQSDSSPSFIRIPLVDKSEYPVTEADVAEWESAYPAVDVRQELREIRQWNINNPTKRKTKRGVRSHITRWLAKEQDKGGSSKGNGKEIQPEETEFQRVTRIAKEKGYEKFKGHAHETPEQFIHRIQQTENPAAQH